MAPVVPQGGRMVAKDLKALKAFSIRVILPLLLALVVVIEVFVACYLTMTTSTRVISSLSTEIRREVRSEISTLVETRLLTASNAVQKNNLHYKKYGYPFDGTMEDVIIRGYGTIAQYPYFVAAPYNIAGYANQTWFANRVIQRLKGSFIIDFAEPNLRKSIYFDPVSQSITNETLKPDPPLFRKGPGGTLLGNLGIKMNEFTWHPIGIINPGNGMGNLQEGLMGIFDANGTLVGQHGVSMSLFEISAFLLSTIEDNDNLRNARLVIFDSTQQIIAISHGGSSDPNERFNFTTVNDTVLTGAYDHFFTETNGTCGEESWNVELDGTEYFIDVQLISSSVKSRVKLEWCMLMALPRDNVLGEVDRSMKRTIIIVSVVGVAGIIISLVLAILISRSLSGIASGMTSLAALEFSDLRAVKKTRTGLYEVTKARSAYNKLHTALWAFQKYMHRGVVNGLIAGNIRAELGMDRHELTVVFIDLEGFTTLCETYDATQIVELAAPFFEEMSKAIVNENGVIDKFIGDCIMAFWGAPEPLPNHQASAVKSVIAGNLAIQVRNKTHSISLKFRCGLHSGEALVGNFGSVDRFDFTIVGDTVNTAARLEPLNKEFKTQALMSDSVYSALPADLQEQCQYMGNTLLVGKIRPTAVYQLIFDAEEVVGNKEWLAAIKEFEAGNFAHCKQLLSSYYKTPSARAVMMECDEFLSGKAIPSQAPTIRHMKSK